MADGTIVGVKFQGIDKFCEELGKLSGSLGQLWTAARMYQRVDKNKSRRMAEQLWIDWFGDMSTWFVRAKDYFDQNWFTLNDYDKETYDKLDEEIDKVQYACGRVMDELRGNTSTYLGDYKFLDGVDERNISEDDKERSRRHMVRFWQKAYAEAHRLVGLGDGLRDSYDAFGRWLGKELD